MLNSAPELFESIHCEGPKRLFTVKELSEYIGWPISTIYSKKCRGLFPKESIVKFEHSSKLFFDKQIIDTWIDKQRSYR